MARKTFDTKKISIELKVSSEDIVVSLKTNLFWIIVAANAGWQVADYLLRMVP